VSSVRDEIRTEIFFIIMSANDIILRMKAGAGQKKEEDAKRQVAPSYAKAVVRQDEVEQILGEHSAELSQNTGLPKNATQGTVRQEELVRSWYERGSNLLTAAALARIPARAMPTNAKKVKRISEMSELMVGMGFTHTPQDLANLAQSQYASHRDEYDLICSIFGCSQRAFNQAPSKGKVVAKTREEAELAVLQREWQRRIEAFRSIPENVTIKECMDLLSARIAASKSGFETYDEDYASSQDLEDLSTFLPAPSAPTPNPVTPRQPWLTAQRNRRGPGSGGRGRGGV